MTPANTLEELTNVGGDVRSEASMSVSKDKTFRNVIYTLVTKGAVVVCGTLTSLVVARNLSPSDYGLVGFATIIIGFLLQFNEMGLNNAVICRAQLLPGSLQTAFVLKVIISSSVFVIALLVAPLGRHFFDHPATANVIRVLALTFLVSTIGFAPRVMLTRELNYRALVIPGVASAMVQCGLAVILVLHGWSYWAVVIASVGSSLAGGIALQLTKRVPFGLHFEWTDAQEYLKFGLPLVGAQILFFLSLNLDNFLVGSKMGSKELGYYELAFTVGSLICTLLSDTVMNVLAPTFSAIQENPGALRRWYLKTLELVGFIAVIANTALFANAPLFLVTLLGKGTNKWLPAALALKVLCIYGIARAMTVPMAICIMVRGETKLLLRANIVGSSAEILLLLLALRSGRLEFVATAVLIAYLIQTAILLPYLRLEFSISFGDFAAKAWPMIPAMVMGVVITRLLPATYGQTLFELAMRVIFTATVVALTHGLFNGFRCFREAGSLIAP